MQVGWRAPPSVFVSVSVFFYSMTGHFFVCGLLKRGVKARKIKISSNKCMHGVLGQCWRKRHVSMGRACFWSSCAHLAARCTKKAAARSCKCRSAQTKFSCPEHENSYELLVSSSCLLPTTTTSSLLITSNSTYMLRLRLLLVTLPLLLGSPLSLSGIGGGGGGGGGGTHQKPRLVQSGSMGPQESHFIVFPNNT